MATRKFLFVNSTGLPEEQAVSDDIQLGAMGIGGAAPGSGLDMFGTTLEMQAGVLSMSGGTITNLVDPSSDQDAATKAYVDSVAQGLDIKGSCRVASAAALAACTPAGSGAGKTLTANANGALSVDGVALSAGDRVLIKDQAAGADNGIYSVTATGGAGAAFVLTRTADFDGSGQVGEVSAGAFTFIEEGTAYADSGWVLATNNPIVVDTTALSFTQFSGAGSFTGGNGIDITGTVISVDTASANGMTFNAGLLEIALHDSSLSLAANGLKAAFAGAELQDNGGIEVVLADQSLSKAAGLKVDLHDASLHLQASGIAVQLADASLSKAAGLKVDLHDASLALAGSGLQLQMSGTTLELDAGNGVRVKGLPSQFEINGSAVSANVTHTNVDVLVAGTASNADSLHQHAKVQEAITTVEIIGAGDAVGWSTTNDKCEYGDAAVDSRSAIFGITTDGAAANASCTVVRSGVAANVIAGATAGDRYYVGGGGGLVAGTGSLVSGDNIILAGVAKNATDLEVRIQYIGKKS
jgi:hypothetical protein